MSTPIKRVNLPEEIFNRIVGFIQEGQLKPGQKLMNERELCQMFDASRTSVREALNGLISVGVIVKMRDGNYVCDNLSEIMLKPISILLDSKVLDLAQAFEARILMESQMSRLAAIKATGEELGELERCLGEPEEGEDAIMRKSMDFHRCIAACTKNVFLIEMYNPIFKLLSKLQYNEDSLRQVKKSEKMHRDIYDAIAAHDPDRAERMTVEHLLILQETIHGQ